MDKIYKGQVNQLRQALINQIKLTFINPEGEDTDIEFNEAFEIWRDEHNTYAEGSVKVLDIITGLKIAAGDCYLTGEDNNFNQFDDLELDSIWDLYELAHILDTLTAGHYKVLSNG